MLQVKAPGTIRRFRLLDKVRVPVDDLLGRLERRKFRGLEEGSAEETAWGWTTLEHLLDTQFEIETCVHDPFLLFGLRIDKKRVPAALVRAELKLMDKAQRIATGKPMKPKERRDHRDEIKERLLRRVLPSAQQVPVIWNLARGRVYVGSTSAQVVDIFRPLFEDTFDVELQALDALGTAEAYAEATLPALPGLAPMKLAGAQGAPALVAAAEAA